MTAFLTRLWVRSVAWLRGCNALWPGFVLLALATPVQAQEVRFERVAEGVYAHVGELGGRTAVNQGLNANIGLVLTPGGAVLIDSGATARSARRIAEAARQVTALPIRWVINTGGQDHRWLGNGYFKAQGAQLIGHDARVLMSITSPATFPPHCGPGLRRRP